MAKKMSRTAFLKKVASFFAGKNPLPTIPGWTRLYDPDKQPPLTNMSGQHTIVWITQKTVKRGKLDVQVIDRHLRLHVDLRNLEMTVVLNGKLQGWWDMKKGEWTPKTTPVAK